MPASASKPVKPLPEIPDKLYFRIGEVAKLCGVPAYVLRFWESEFPQLRPNKSGSGQRLYRRREVEAARRIRTLLYDEGYTIAGARQNLAAARLPDPDPPPAPPAPSALTISPTVAWMRSELQEILSVLSKPTPSAHIPRPPAETSTEDSPVN